MTPELLSTQELIDITKSRGEGSIYGNQNEKYALCYYYNFDNFYTFVYSNPMSEYNFDAKVNFTIENYLLELFPEDIENTWNIRLNPNQTLLKKINVIDFQKKVSWDSNTTYKFIKV